VLVRVRQCGNHCKGKCREKCNKAGLEMNVSRCDLEHVWLDLESFLKFLVSSKFALIRHLYFHDKIYQTYQTSRLYLKTPSCLFFKTQRFGDWILSPSSGKTYSVCPYLRTPVRASRWVTQANASWTVHKKGDLFYLAMSVPYYEVISRFSESIIPQ
jgi:hypothetical protein